MRAINFGAGMAQPGYNIFVTGPQSGGKHTSVKRALQRLAASMPAPPDIAYVHNFAHAHRPRILRFAAGQGAVFKTAMGEFVAALKTAMPRLFESDDYRPRRSAIEEEFHRTAEGAFDTLRRNAEAQGLALVERSEGSFEFRPSRDGLVLSEDDYRRLSSPTAKGRPESARALRSELDRTMDQLASLRLKTVEKVRALDRELGEMHLRGLMRPLSERYAHHRETHEYLETVFRDVVGHIDALQATARGDSDERAHAMACRSTATK